MTMEMISNWSEYGMRILLARTIDFSVVFILVGFIWLCIHKWAPPQVGYWLFCLVLLKLIAPPQFSVLTLFPQTVAEQIAESDYWKPSIHFKSPAVADPFKPAADSFLPAAPFSPTPDSISFLQILFWLWVFLTAVLFLRQIWEEWKTYRLVKSAPPFPTALYPIPFDELIQLARVNQPIRWATGEWVKSPAAYGFIRPTVILPQDLTDDFTPQQIRWIVLHELEHIRRWDSLFSGLQKIVMTLFFFNPLVWWANAAVDQLREYICDDAAVKHFQSSRKECGEGFLSVVLKAQGLPTFMPAAYGMIGAETRIRSRLVRILDRGISRIRMNYPFRVLLSALAAVLIPFGSGVALETFQWSKISTPQAPPPQHGSRIVYDSRRDRLVLHGQTDISPDKQAKGVFAETWEWDGYAWEKVSTEGPSVRWHGMAFDESKGVTVLYGGSSAYQEDQGFNDFYLTQDTWTWDGSTWKKMDLERSPPVRHCMSLVYDPIEKKVLLYGGQSKHIAEVFQDMWYLDGNSWTLHNETAPRLTGNEMVYDPRRDRFFVFGGLYDDEVNNDVWEYDRRQWRKIETQGAKPSPRMLYSAAYEPNLEKIVIFGGGFHPFWFHKDVGMEYHNDLWTWDGIRWESLRSYSKPSPRTGSSLIFSPMNRSLFLFGGSHYPGQSFNELHLYYIADTWIFPTSRNAAARFLFPS